MTAEHYRIEDLGVQAQGDCWIILRHGRNPKTGGEVGLASLSRGGFMVIDPIARAGRQVRPPADWADARAGTEIWALGQGPDGAVYVATSYSVGGPDALMRWDWEGDRATVVRDLPTPHCLGLDVAPDGRVYLSEAVQNTLSRFTPATGALESLPLPLAEITKHVNNVCCAADGWVYLNATDYRRTLTIAYHPDTNETRCIEYTGLTKDGAGHVLVADRRWGRQIWLECVGGTTVPINSAAVQLAEMELAICDIKPPARTSPFAFSDGSYIQRLYNERVTCVAPDGKAYSFVMKREPMPLRLFCIASGGGKIWCGTFIPLNLCSYEPSTGTTEFLGNPTTVTGEIYSMVWSRNKLFIASYGDAELACYDPSRPWLMNGTAAGNPAQLGLMKNDGRPLQRPHGSALGPDGTVFFAAHGGYGCDDSGICRINPDNYEITRWIYPDTYFDVLVYLPATNELLVSERRAGEDGIRFTFVSPDDGSIIRSEIVIPDIGSVVSWLTDGGDIVYGMHSSRATLFMYSLAERRIVKKVEELRFGDHCYNALMFGPDDRIWGLTNECVYALDRDLDNPAVIAYYEDHAGRNLYRFGMCLGPDGNVYFPNGIHLMRVLCP